MSPIVHLVESRAFATLLGIPQLTGRQIGVFEDVSSHQPSTCSGESTAGSRAFSSAFVARTLAQARYLDSRKTGTAERCLTSPVCTPLSLRELVLDRLVQASKGVLNDTLS